MSPLSRHVILNTFTILTLIPSIVMAKGTLAKAEGTVKYKYKSISHTGVHTTECYDQNHVLIKCPKKKVKWPIIVGIVVGVVVLIAVIVIATIFIRRRRRNTATKLNFIKPSDTYKPLSAPAPGGEDSEYGSKYESTIESSDPHSNAPYPPPNGYASEPQPYDPFADSYYHHSRYSSNASNEYNPPQLQHNEPTVYINTQYNEPPGGGMGGFAGSPPNVTDHGPEFPRRQEMGGVGQMP